MIESIYAVLSETQGIVSIGSCKENHMPLVSCTQDMLGVFLEIAEKVAKETEENIEVVRFDRKDVIQRFKGDEK